MAEGFTNSRGGLYHTIYDGGRGTGIRLSNVRNTLTQFGNVDITKTYRVTVMQNEDKFTQQFLLFFSNNSAADMPKASSPMLNHTNLTGTPRMVNMKFWRISNTIVECSVSSSINSSAGNTNWEAEYQFNLVKVEREM